MNFLTNRKFLQNCSIKELSLVEIVLHLKLHLEGAELVINAIFLLTNALLNKILLVNI